MERIYNKIMICAVAGIVGSISYQVLIPRPSNENIPSVVRTVVIPIQTPKICKDDIRLYGTAGSNFFYPIIYCRDAGGNQMVCPKNSDEARCYRLEDRLEEK